MARDNGTGSGLMNDCLHYQEKLHDWVDQELDAPTSEEIDLHLSHCPQCADAAKGIQHMKQLIRSKAWKPQTPENLRVGVQEMLTVESTRMQTRSRWSGRTILPLALQFISSSPGAALGARPFRTSLNLSTAVPIGVS